MPERASGGVRGEISEDRRFCWFRFRRHRFVGTGSFRFGPAFNRGPVLRCRVCGHKTTAVGPRLEALLARGRSDV